MITFSKYKIVFLTLTSIMAVCFTPSVRAADATAADKQPAQEDMTAEAVPLITIEGSGELQMDAGIGNYRTTSLYATVEPEVTVNLSDAFRQFWALRL